MSLARLSTALLFLGLLSGCSIQSAKKNYILAEKLWADGKYSAAVAEFDKVTKKDPTGELGLQALYRSAMTQSLFLKQHDQAIEKLKTYAELTPKKELSWEAQKQIGTIYFLETKHYRPAIAHYQAMLREKPDAPEAAELQFRIAKAHFFLWEFEESVNVYEEIIRKFPQSDWAERASYEIGISLFTSGEQNSDESGPTTSNAKTNMGVYQRALKAFEKFIEQHPKSSLIPQARFGIAQCYEELDQLEQAYQLYANIREHYPSPKVIDIKMIRIQERLAQKNQKNPRNN